MRIAKSNSAAIIRGMKETDTTPKYWFYKLDETWSVFAGKTDVDNDLLSLHFALPDDHWFHISATQGSHVLLRSSVQGAVPPRDILEKAAAIAAWHSKARNGGTCSVDCTLAKNVSKPKGVPAGTVEIKESRRLRVTPQLP